MSSSQTFLSGFMRKMAFFYPALMLSLVVIPIFIKGFSKGAFIGGGILFFLSCHLAYFAYRRSFDLDASFGLARVRESDPIETKVLMEKIAILAGVFFIGLGVAGIIF